MKCVYPYYAYLHEVGADLTGRFIKAFWHEHIWDWSSLLFNRHGNHEAWEEKWDTDFAGRPVPMVENTALSNDRLPLKWTKHSLSRHDEIRHPETGLAGYQFNHRQPCRVRASFKPPFGTREKTSMNRRL